MAKKEFTVRFDRERLKWIEKEAVRLGCSKAAIINMAIVDAMEKEKNRRR